MQAQVLMIGTDLAAKGGISSVLRMYEEAGLFSERVAFLPSYRDGSALGKIKHYAGFLVEYIRTLVKNPSLRMVHVHTASRGSFARKSLVVLLAKLLGRKVLLHMHGAEFEVFYNESSWPAKQCIRFLLRRCDAILALSRQWKQALYRMSGNPDIRVMYNPTTMQIPVDTRGNGKINFLFMGRLGKRKGVYDIIEAAREVRNGKVRINLYGDGEVDAVRQRISDTGVADKVAVCGWISGDQKDKTFRESQALILPSYNEGLPISVLEAMAYGMPVVATDVGGVAEAVEDGRNGYLLDPGDKNRLAECIDKLAESIELRERMGRTSHAMAEKKFALPVIVKQLEGLYDEFLNT